MKEGAFLNPAYREGAEPSWQNAPNFLVVGAPKCGTTTVAHHLQAHPEGFVSNPKEPMFMLQEVVEVVRRRGELSPVTRVGSLPEYRALFDEASSMSARGEASVYYLYLWRWAIPRIKEELGDPRIVICVRNPVRRLFSHFQMELAQGAKWRSFQEFYLSQKGYVDEVVGENRYIAQGRYAQQIRAYQSCFSRVYVMCFEDLERDAVAAMQSLYRFLQINDQVEPDRSVRLARGTSSRFPRSHRKARGVFLRSRSLLDATVGRASTDRLHKRLASLAYPRLSIPRRDRDVLMEIYEPEISEMEKILSRDLSEWRRAD